MRTDALTILDVRRWNDTFAREYDIDEYYTRASALVRLVTRRRLRYIREMANVQPDQRVLEVGCGGGHVLRMFPDNELVGVDVSGEMIQKARRNLKGCRVGLLRGEVADLDLPAAGFDRIICSEVLEHVVDPEALIREMRNLLAPTGRIVITIPNDRLIDGLKAAIRGCGLCHVPPFRRITWGGDHYHLHSWTAGRMRELLSDYFRVEEPAHVPWRMLPLHFCFAATAR